MGNPRLRAELASQLLHRHVASRSHAFALRVRCLGICGVISKKCKTQARLYWLQAYSIMACLLPIGCRFSQKGIKLVSVKEKTSNFSHVRYQSLQVSNFYQIPYLFDCKPRLVKFFFHYFVRSTIKGGLHFLFVSHYPKVHGAPSLIGYVFFDHVHIRRGRDYDQQREVVVVKQHYHQGCKINPKRASTWKYLRDLGNQCSRAAYINFWRHFVRLTIE